ncbi:MAG: hypothetical protein OEQ25_18310 [Gammaproteobacteria bacterium]|nr:hypothetical protein [Gammaproteobacteria bacterium]MDH3509098.1 hypothetical protein [Gammaproteobacteria bacterium]
MPKSSPNNNNVSPSQKPAPKPRAWILAVYLVLFALVIPWYWPAADARHVFGIPLWALVTLAAVLLTSVFTAWVYLTRSEGEGD